MKKPFRIEADLVIAAETLEDAMEWWECALENTPFHCEGASVGQMKQTDVVPDSPLADDLAKP